VSKQIADHADSVDVVPDISLMNVEQLINAVLAGATFTWTNPGNSMDFRVASKAEANDAFGEDSFHFNPVHTLLAQGDAIAAQRHFDETIDSIIRDTVIEAVEHFKTWPDDFDFDFYLGSDAA
tara:strand:- start:10782 stop:11150 length:369 start_codon:yes stop_codon:yes gene_type:complete